MLDDAVAVIRDVPFADRPTGPLLLDLYLPGGGSAAAPLVIWHHGGGWFTGERTLAPDLRRFFAVRGIAMASIEYRLTADALFPAQLHDVRTAIRFLRGEGARWNLDGDRIGVWGSSAGGHLAALAGLTGHRLQFDGEEGSGDASVAAVAESYGPADLFAASPTTPTGAPSPEARLLGGSASEHPGLAEAASPLHQVHASAPPFQISHGTADALVSHHDSERLHAALIAAGVDSTLYLVDGYRHGFLNPAGRLEAGLTDVMDDGRLLAEGSAAARIRGAELQDRPGTFGFDDIGDFFVRHLCQEIA